MAPWHPGDCQAVWRLSDESAQPGPRLAALGALNALRSRWVPQPQRLEAAGLAISVGPDNRLAQVQEPGGTAVKREEDWGK